MKTIIGKVQKIALVLILLFGMNALASAKSKIPVKATELQKSITDYLAKNYAGYTIKSAYKIDQNKVIDYEVNAAKENKSVCLLFDSKGAFLKVKQPMIKTPKSGTANKTTNKKTQK